MNHQEKLDRLTTIRVDTMKMAMNPRIITTIAPLGNWDYMEARKNGRLSLNIGGEEVRFTPKKYKKVSN